MKKNTFGKRTLAIFISVIMILATIPVGAFAEDDPVTENNDQIADEMLTEIDSVTLGEPAEEPAEDPEENPGEEPGEETPDEWQPADNPTYYYKDGEKVTSEIAYEIGGELYAFDSDGVLQKDVLLSKDGKLYYFGTDGKAVSGIQSIDEEGYYFDPETKVAKTGLVIDEDGNKYLLGEDHKALTKWQQIDGEWFYFGRVSFKAYDGWHQIGTSGRVYYFDPETKAAVEGLVKIDTHKYYFKGTSTTAPYQRTGLKKIDGKRYYFYTAKDFKNQYAAKSKFKTIDGKKYYFGKSYAALEGLQTISGSKYYFSRETSEALSGLRKINGKKYYFSKDSYKALSGLRKIEGKRYYFAKDSKAALKSKFKTINKKKYYFKSDCTVAEGWITINGKKRYYNHDGSIARKMDKKAYSMSSGSKYLIICDIDKFKLAVYKGSKYHWQRLYFWNIGTGKYETPTPDGTFILGKNTTRKLHGKYFDGTRTPYRYWYYTRFHGGYMMHSYAFKTASKPIKAVNTRLGAAVSHGCIRMHLYAAKWVYDTIPKGTKMVAYRKPMSEKQKAAVAAAKEKAKKQELN